MTSAVDAYLNELVARVLAATGDRLRGVYAIGSLALGDYRPGRSDIDVAAFTTDVPSLEERRAIAAQLEHDALPCPARGLEFVLYAEPEAPRYALNLNTGRGLAHQVSVDAAENPGFWFVLDLAIAREHARTVYGAPPAAVMPPIADATVRAALLDALAWYGTQASGPETILAAGRAWRWATEGVWSSKGDAGRWAAARPGVPPVVSWALGARDAGGALPDATAITRFVDAVRASLT